MTTNIELPHKMRVSPLLPENWQESSWFQRLFLGALFSLSFILPVIFGLKFFSDTATSQAPVVDEADPVFPENIAIQWQGAFLKVSDSPLLTPKADQDYMLSAWFNLRRVPEAGESTALLSKVDHSLPLKPGFSLSLSREGSLVRPVLYWKDSHGKGGWYHFSEIRIVPRTWFNLVLSVQNSDTIGLNIITLEEGKEPQRELLGGFKLSVPVNPLSNSPLYFGSHHTGSFRGKIGPVAIFAGKELRDDYKEILKETASDPLSIPPSVKESEVILWTPDGKKDLSPFSHPVGLSKAAERGSKKKGGA